MSLAAVLAGERAWWVEPTDVLAGLRRIPDESIHCVVTSVPYFGLRSYGTDPQVWGGDPSCGHVWESIVKPAANGLVNNAMQGDTLSGNSATRRPSTSEFCLRCGAWRGELGQEPTVALYVCHLVEVFREVRRVLRSDGTVWLNIGSSYAGSGKGPTGYNGIGNQELRQGFVNGPRKVEKEGGVISVRGRNGDEPFVLRDDLTPEEMVYVLTELAAHLAPGGESSFPNLAVGVDQAVTALAHREEE